MKKERLWTDKTIKDFLGKPINQEKYKAFKIEDAKKAEIQKNFQKIMINKIEKR